jgi:hypothetical protein
VLVHAGDFLAISNLIYKIGLELKKNPKSAPDYQHLLIELEALDRALKLLQCIKPAQHELRRLEGIRALASICQRPLEEFLTKIEKFEEHLGSWNTSNHQFSGLTRRLQWSMKYKEEVKSLRAKLAPNVATITVLLATQTIDTLLNAESDRFQIARELNCKLSSQCKILADLKQTTLGITSAQARLEAEQSHMTAAAVAQDQDLRTLKSKADELLKDNITHEIHLYNQDAILVDIQDNGTTINSRTQETHILATAIRQDAAEIKALTDSVLGRALDLMSAVTAGISKIQDIITLIAQMIRLTTQFTIEMRETMGKLLRAFWDIQRRLARLERFLPKQIDLPVVRFRDAFNEMRSLPYDLSRQWQTFQRLVAVVFTNRQGLHRVNMGQYFVTNVRIAQRLNPICWSNAIEPGDELSMTMILDDIEAEDGFCPYKSCGASTKDVASRRGGKTCPNCFRFAAISQRKQVPPDAAPMHAPELEVLEKEDIELYHSIQVVQALLTSACDEAGSSKQPSLQTSRDELPLAESNASTTSKKGIHSLTAEALRKVPKVTPMTARSETNSSQKSRNSSSKGSSGGKTGLSSLDITMHINGIAVGIPADSGQRITIQSKGVNISVGGKGRSTDKEYASSRIGPAPSITSRTSKTSSSRGKEKRLEHDNGMRVLRDDEIRTLDRAGRRSQSSSRFVSRDQEEEPIAYGA